MVLPRKYQHVKYVDQIYARFLTNVFIGENDIENVHVVVWYIILTRDKNMLF